MEASNSDSGMTEDDGAANNNNNNESQKTTSSIGDDESPRSSSSVVGDAVAVTVLLSDWTNFGLSERICYHFDLTETLQAFSEGNQVLRPVITESPPLSKHTTIGTQDVCGVVGLLECVPTLPVNQLTKKQWKAIGKRIRDFNKKAMKFQTEKKLACYQPPYLPLRLNITTRLSYAYQLTRIAFCLDASPTLVSMFGVGNYDDRCCALDRLPDMVNLFFHALIEPIAASYMTVNQGTWQPVLAVTVLAVYPRGPDTSNTSLLVRDFRVFDKVSAAELSQTIGEWALGEVETQIAIRLSSRGADSALDGYDSWAIPKYSTSFSDVLEAGDLALSLLPASARPCIVVATDGRSVACDGVLDLFSDGRRVDTPIFVLDLSAATSHTQRDPVTIASYNHPISLLNDLGGSSAFPLHLSDDSESLHELCKATGGAFFDMDVLREAAHTLAGQVPDSSPLSADLFLVNRRRMIKPNAVQWYFLFSLSQLTRTPNASSGKLVPPGYVRTTATLYGRDGLISLEKVQTQTRQRVERRESLNVTPQRRQPSRVTVIVYKLSQVRIKGFLLSRIKEGYRTQNYGQNTIEKNKVSIQMTLTLERGTVLHYEVLYTSLPGVNPLIGSAQVKIELSGESGFIQRVKNDYMANINVPQKVSAVVQGASARLCKYLRWVRQGDEIQNLLFPIKWTNEISSGKSPFVTGLRALTSLQLGQFFRRNEFDVICTGQLPHTRHNDVSMSEFVHFDNGEEELYSALAEWSSQIISRKRNYVKVMPNPDGLTEYAVVHIHASPRASRLFKITVDTVVGTDTSERLILVESLKRRLSSIKNILLLDMVMDCFLTGSQQSPSKDGLLSTHFSHESWDLVKDPELLPLITKRRNDIDKFLLMHSTSSYARFARLVTTERNADGITDTYLDEYQITVHIDKVVVNMRVERDNGRFLDYGQKGVLPEITRAHRLFVRVKRRDQECGLALRSRTELLGMLSPDEPKILPPGVQVTCLERLLAYASKQTRKLRFFAKAAVTANQILEELTIDLMLPEYLDVPIMKLDIGSDASVAGEKAGLWFLVNFDRHTLCIVRLGLVNAEDEGAETEDSVVCYRDLVFFTVGISDLYCPRDDVADDDGSAQSHITEHLPIENLADAIEVSHGMNYSRAAYSALCHDHANGSSPVMAPQDIQHALSFCNFVEVANVFIAEEDEVKGEQQVSSKLSTILGEIVAPLPGHPETQFYFSDVSVGAKDLSQSRNELLDNSVNSYHRISDDASDTVMELDEVAHPSTDEDLDISEDGPAFLQNIASDVTPPIFVQFAAEDGRIVSLADISEVQGSQLRVLIPVFKKFFSSCSSKAPMPTDDHPHIKVARELESTLKAYVAEQALEGWRKLGSAIDDAGMRAVQRCLRQARNVQLSFYDVSLYDSKSDTMFAASGAVGHEAALDVWYTLFRTELSSNRAISLREASRDTFCVIDADEADQRMKFWCFITLKPSLGVCTIEVFHPGSFEESSSTLAAVHSMVYQTGRRVNQLLVLNTLHRTRLASSLLILEEHEPSKNLGCGDDYVLDPSVLSCPVKFTASFKLFHRCSATQVILAIEATVLHSFAVSNRRGYFVYKDETGAIFYLKLSPASGPTLSDGTFELNVYGVDEPGPSITVQLNRLLQKRLLSLSVDALSLVLTKNTGLPWKEEDFQLVRSFRGILADLGECDGESTNVQDCVYEFPEEVYDPIAVLLFFRQNLCGSTFFHRIQQSNPGQTDIETDSSGHSWEWLPTTGLEVNLDPSEFLFFYNNAPSPLDPSNQQISTLTSKGVEYTRKAGNGVAIIEISLVDRDGSDNITIKVGLPVDKRAKSLDTPLKNLRMKKLALDGDDGQLSSYGVRVRIIDTGMNRNALHMWLRLTLDQVLVGWTIERHIERFSKNLLTDDFCESTELAHKTRYNLRQRQVVLDQLSPGLPNLISMCHSSCNLPHPAIDHVEHHGVVKALSVATMTLSLLERSVMGVLIKTGGWNNRKVFIARLSREQRPRQVNIKWDASNEGALVQEVGVENPAVFKDAPTDCPEYICFYCHQGYRDDGSRPTVALSLLFNKVVVQGKTGEGRSLAEALRFLKEKQPSFFMRSLAFVLTVKRNRRSLLTYNWDPRILSEVKARVKEFDLSAISSFGLSLESQQRKCLGALSPPVVKGRVTQSALLAAAAKPDKSIVDAIKTTTKCPSSTEDAGEMKTHVRRIKRPTMIRRPKLTGKSVEGAAVQAVAASRAKASSSRHSQPPLVSKVPARDGSAARRRNNLSEETSVIKPNSRGREDRIAIGRGREVAPVERELAGLYGSYYSAVASNITARIPRMLSTKLQKRWLDSRIQTVSLSTRNFILVQSTKLRTDAVELFSALPRLVGQDLISSFTTFLRKQYPGLQSLATNSDPSQSENFDIEFLMIQLKATMSVVFRIEVMKRKRGKVVACLDIWLLQSPSVKKRRFRKLHLAKTEKSCVAIDLKLALCHITLTLDVQFFNFSGNLIEQVVESGDSEFKGQHACALVRELAQKYPYDKQEDVNGLLFNVFEASIILASYNSDIIDMYDAQQLFATLESEPDTVNMMRCGPGALCFLQRLSVQETVSSCFLVREPGVTTKLKLLVLCRNEGSNIEHYMLPEGSNVAAKIVTVIVVQAARLALDALELAGKKMRRMSLWALFTMKQRGRNAPTLADFEDLLGMVVSTSLRETDRVLHSFFLANNAASVKWSALIACMKKEATFFPYWSFLIGGAEKLIFYVASMDCFLLFDIVEEGATEVVDMKLFIQDTALESRRERMCELSLIVTNYILHFLWQSM